VTLLTKVYSYEAIVLNSGHWKVCDSGLELGLGRNLEKSLLHAWVRRHGPFSSHGEPNQYHWKYIIFILPRGSDVESVLDNEGHSFSATRPKAATAGTSTSIGESLSAIPYHGSTAHFLQQYHASIICSLREASFNQH